MKFLLVTNKPSDLPPFKTHPWEIVELGPRIRSTVVRWQTHNFLYPTPSHEQFRSWRTTNAALLTIPSSLAASPDVCCLTMTNWIDWSIKLSFDFQAYSEAINFIASEGPAPSTIEYFLRAIWDNDVNVIVMLNNPDEESKVSGLLQGLNIVYNHEQDPDLGPCLYIRC